MLFTKNGKSPVHRRFYPFSWYIIQETDRVWVWPISMPKEVGRHYVDNISNVCFRNAFSWTLCHISLNLFLMSGNSPSIKAFPGINELSERPVWLILHHVTGIQDKTLMNANLTEKSPLMSFVYRVMVKRNRTLQQRRASAGIVIKCYGVPLMSLNGIWNGDYDLIYIQMGVGGTSG